METRGGEYVLNEKYPTKLCSGSVEIREPPNISYVCFVYDGVCGSKESCFCAHLIFMCLVIPMSCGDVYIAQRKDAA